MKAKRVTNLKLPYIVLISKFVAYFGVDVEDELDKFIGILNQVS